MGIVSRSTFMLAVPMELNDKGVYKGVQLGVLKSSVLSHTALSSTSAGMVSFNDPTVIANEFLALLKLWHVAYGLYIWEFLNTLDYEWSVIRGRRPYRWTIWLYSLTRLATLAAVISSIITFDDSRPVDCQLLITSDAVLGSTASAGASLLIAIRVIAIWNKNRIVMAISLGSWVANVSTLIHGVALLRGTRAPGSTTCVSPNSSVSRLNMTVTLCVDVVMLLIMLVALLRWRQDDGSASRLIHLLWTQVFNSLNLNAVFNVMFEIPSLIALSIAATRMYRSLTDFGPRDVFVSLPKGIGLSSPETNHIHVVTKPLEAPEHTDCEQYPGVPEGS
ncbi:hypothetical protein F5148DRAFT_396867 [Russula earlei]|uniref:Uncharacterized protein n=1 Tax=Russula earlei TaxID=71964 RepID=A0ACC0U000_9AGAM|nr:hypothetical protein F5148DRAFT_396867 [Russula earlei]